MQYGKLNGKEFIGSEQPLDGFLPVEMNPPERDPEDGYFWSYEWATDSEKIYRVWTLTEYVDYETGPSIGDYAEAGKILLGVTE